MTAPTHFVEVIDFRTRRVIERRGPFSRGVAFEVRASMRDVPSDRVARVAEHAPSCALLDPEAEPQVCDCGRGR